VTWSCSVCGKEHEGFPFDWGWDEPAYWDGGRDEGDNIDSDLCVWTDDQGDRCYFIRGVLHMPILGADDTFAYGVWSSLSESSFSRVVELWDDPARVHEPPYFGWLSNSIPGYPETLNLPLDVLTNAIDLRPALVLHDGDHPLVQEQRSGITLERVREIAELNTHAA
jgi:hypothetical protein